MSRALMRIQPKICVEPGTHDVPEPSWLIGSAISVTDRMSSGIAGTGVAMVMPGIGSID